VAVVLAAFAALCFGAAVVTSKRGLRFRDARAGAVISIPTAAVLFALASPFVLETAAFVLPAMVIFGLVGLFFPAVATLVTFVSNDRLGPTVTSAVSSTAPLFALVAAAIVLGEHIPAKAAFASLGVAAGITLMSWRPAASGARRLGWALLWPISGAMIRGSAQVIAKAGLLLWPNPFAAALIGYAVSSVTVAAADRLPRAERIRIAGQGRAWFVLTGIFNGAAVLLMYTALSMAPVSLIAPIVATFPLVTAILSAAVLREEPLNLRLVAGSALIVAAVAYLLAA
jgi:drug/metabolite transporter (DMT)-like permease